MPVVTAIAAPEDDNRQPTPGTKATASVTVSDEMVPLDEAIRYFPKAMCKKSLYKRTHEGIEGIRLRTIYDGYRYYTSEERVTFFLDCVAAARAKRLAEKHKPRHLSDEEEYEAALARLKAL